VIATPISAASETAPAPFMFLTVLSFLPCQLGSLSRTSRRVVSPCLARRYREGKASVPDIVVFW